MTASFQQYNKREAEVNAVKCDGNSVRSMQTRRTLPLRMPVLDSGLFYGTIAL